MRQKNKLAGLPGPPPDIWRGVRIITDGAVHILNTTRWPRGKPLGTGNAVEVLSSNGVTVYELVGAMQVAHKLRQGKLPRSHKKQIRMELRNLLGPRRYSDKAFNDLFERLGL